MSTQTLGTVPALTLSWRMRMAMESAGYRQADMAEVLQVNPRTVNRWLTDQVEPKRSALMAWAMATGTPYVWLETGEAPSGGPDGAVSYTSRDSNPEPADLESGEASGDDDADPLGVAA